MSIIEAIILGIIQGLTEFLPVSSSGHLELGKALLNIQLEENLGFTVMVHLATVLSTITVFLKEINVLIKGTLKFKWNDETQYVAKILLSSIPVLIVGLLFETQVESLFSGNLLIVGAALLLTSVLLASTNYIRFSSKKKIPYADAIVIGVAQALAVIPGLSRSGSTIATGLLQKNNREEVAKFSFLMVLIPIIGASLLKIFEWVETGNAGAGVMQLISGFIAAYITGFLACKWMINLVKKGKLIWFAIYCALIGSIAILTSF